jgi:hypothetical protein
MSDLTLLEEDSSAMTERPIDLNMLARIDSEQKATAARADKIEEGLHKLEVAVGEIRGSIKPPVDTPWWLRFIVAPVCVAVILATGGAVIHLEIEVASIKGLDTKQAMWTISTQSNQVQAEGKVPDQSTVRDIRAASRTVSAAIHEYPQYPEVWRAASSLVNLRTLDPGSSNIPSDVAGKVGPPIPNQGNCFTMPLPPSVLGQMGPEQTNSIWAASIFWWHDCTLFMDDTDGFNRSNVMGYIREKVGSAANVRVYLDLTLVRVNVVYHGGHIIPARKMVFYSCGFGFDVPDAPEKRGRELLEAILSEGFGESPLEISVPIV